MNELTMALIMATACLIVATAGVVLIQSIVTGRGYSQREHVRAATWAHFLWWCIVFPFAFIGILFPTFAVANLIWKFLP